ncbi:hypothetical protein GCM10010287_51820 [Streptomyces variabilis]|uniref:Uncharacterized protein n=1 Tax=Streptomyces variabilis TaxID=67372 RepID=A0ABQ2U5D7_9ACTN|nr:hypothetical protein [Streptomyces variabilis]GGP61865.1 hypothetical protein GCM10010265_44920 [Streptomyces griseoincarnatus]GGT70983.1 hypothetical protein GCM10010287_51820 [Streptomyces variabilis]
MNPVQNPDATTEPATEGERGGQAAIIAETVGAVLAHAADALQQGTAADAAEIQMITDAMVRLLVGAPLRSDGKLTIKTLAEEAGLRRNKLTHKHTGLKDLFYALVKAQQGPPRPFTDKEREVSDKQKKDLTRVRAERDGLRTKIQQMARIIHVLEVENHHLRESAGTDGIVRVMRGR